MVLEPDTTHEVFCVIPEHLKPRTKELKQFIEEAEDAGLIALKKDEFDLIKEMDYSVRANTDALELLIDCGMIEQSFFAEYRGYTIKARPDIFIKPCARYPRGLIVDLKTTRDASNKFKRDAYNLGYHIQAGWYAHVLMNALNLNELPDFTFIAVENVEPYSASVFNCTSEFVEYGYTKALELFDKLTYCMESGRWPSYFEDAQDLDLPAYVEVEPSIEVTYE